MRIAFVVHDYHKAGGHSRYVAELVERYACQHEVHVFSNTFLVPLPAGVVAHRVPALRHTALTTIFSFLPCAAWMLRHGRFDVVHAQGALVPRANVVTAHICNGRWLAHRRQHDGPSVGWKDHLFAGLVVPLERHVYGRPGTAVIAISEALRTDLVASYRVSGELTVIHHGVDDRQFNPGVAERNRAEVRRALGVPEGVPLFLFVGDARKGAAQAAEALEHTPGVLAVVTRSWTDALLATARARGLQGRVVRIEPTPAIERYYGAADVFVLPTPYDAFGMVVTEAMACGLPVITTRAAGASEVIEHGLTGFVLDTPVDVPALGALMRSLATDSALRARIGRTAATAMAAHGWQRVADRTMDVYRRVVGSPAP